MSEPWKITRWETSDEAGFEIGPYSIVFEKGNVTREAAALMSAHMLLEEQESIEAGLKKITDRHIQKVMFGDEATRLFGEE